MSEELPQVVQLPIIDPDNVAEMLCNGPFHLSFQGSGQNTLANLTFTHVRPDAAPLFQYNTVMDRAVVRARIALSIPNLIALRDLLVNHVKTEGEIMPTGGAGSAVRH
jgi:hypothetical protein